MQIVTRSVDETVRVGEALGRIAGAWARGALAGGGEGGGGVARVVCVALDGQLGAGKTQLTRGIAAGAGVEDITLVSSPTYVLMNVYPGRAASGTAGGAGAMRGIGGGGGVTVYHLDAYRVTSGEDLAEGGVGLEEILATGPAVVVVEWAARVQEVLPADRVQVVLEHGSGGGEQRGPEEDAEGQARAIEVEGTGPRSHSIVAALREVLAMREF